MSEENDSMALIKNTEMQIASMYASEWANDEYDKNTQIGTVDALYRGYIAGFLAGKAIRRMTNPRTLEEG